MKYLSIIIPQYNETEKQMFKLFQMLNLQENVNFGDFEVVLVNDCSETKISSKFLSQFGNLDIKQLKTNQNVGSGLCRQFGVDNSSGEYIFFIDADDLIYSVLTISKIINTIKQNGNCDVICGKFLEEIEHEGLTEHSYIGRDDITWLHGKIYQRLFLSHYGIKFPKDLRVNEDSYFNGVVFNIDNLKRIDVDDFFTIWRCNKKSITRKDNKIANITGYPDFIKSKDLMLQKAIAYISFDRYLSMVAQTFIFIYLNSQQKMWDNYDMPKEKEEIDFAIYNLYKKYKTTLLSVNEAIFNKLYNDLRNSCFSNQNYREKVTLEHYYASLCEKYEKK